jgi:hypothetical protein
MDTKSYITHLPAPIFQGLWVGIRASIFWGLLWWVPQPKSPAIATGQYLIRLPRSMIMSLQINVQFISQQCVEWWSNFTSQCRVPYMAGHILWTLSSSSILSHSPFWCVPNFVIWQKYAFSLCRNLSWAQLYLVSWGLDKLLSFACQRHRWVLQVGIIFQLFLSWNT